jgi:hypothetical protein
MGMPNEGGFFMRRISPSFSSPFISGPLRKGKPMKSRSLLMRGLLPLCLLGLGLAPARAASILFVVGNTTLGPGDAKVKALLEAKGHVLTIKTGAAAAAIDANGKALVVISSTVTSADVGTKFRAVTVPALVWEPYILDDMGMTNGVAESDYGTVSGITQVQIYTPSHQMAAGFNGGVAVYDAVGSGTFGKPASSAIKVATYGTDVSKAEIFGYESGAAMFGMSAPARRVGFFFDDNSSASLSGNGDVLFHAAVNWAMNVSQPQITLQPVSVAVNAGATASFSVTATGGALTYQWRKNSNNITGATSSSYTTQATTSGDNGALFSVVVTNTAGTFTSNSAVLTVGNSGPVVGTQPESRAVDESQITTFSVTAGGTPPLSYQWKRAGATISGANAATYTIPPATLADHGVAYTCVISNSTGSVTSSPATLLVVAAPRRSQTQYYQALNSSSTSFKVGWNSQSGNQYAFIEQAGVENLRLRYDYVEIPKKISFPAQQVPDASDPSFLWDVNGDIDEEGAAFTRTGSGTTYTTDETGTLSTNRVDVSRVHNSWENGHEYTLTSESALEAGQISFTSTNASPHYPTQESTTSLDAFGLWTESVNATSVSAKTVFAESLVTTPRWRVSAQIPDYVFSPDYELKPLDEVEAYAKVHRHLPQFPSAQEMSEKGVDITEMNLKLLRTVEELTLHMAALQKDLKSQKAEMVRLKQRMNGGKQGKAGVK